MEQIRRLNAYLKEKYHKKIYKISLNAGTTCPNRDGSLGTGGCIFCSGSGSGDFAAVYSQDITKQIEEGILRISAKVKGDVGYIAYFQAFTGTYGKVEYLEPLFLQAALDERVVAISIGTRPDCLGPDILEMLERLNHIKPVMIELGLQTTKKESVVYIRRGYENEIFTRGVEDLRRRQIEVVVHIILGLPGESTEDILTTIDFVNAHDIQGVKLQLLHVLEGTDLARDYADGKFQVYELEEYAEILCKAIEALREDIVLHRITGDAPKRLLVAPQWSADKKRVLNYINQKFMKESIIQGRRYVKDGNGTNHII